MTPSAKMAVAGRCVVIVSPQFPPSTLAGVHRARHMARHLPAYGWRPIVVRVDERFYSERTDAALGALVPPEVSQVRVKAVSTSLMRVAGVGDVGLRAYPYIAKALDRIVLEQKPSAVFITGFPFYPMLLAGRIKHRYGLPVVLDFQDPWVSAYGATRPVLSKEGLAHRLAVSLEPMALRHADFVTSVSAKQNGEMAVRYPWLDASKMAAIPIGGDPEDFDALRVNPPQTLEVKLDPDLINLSYVGAFLPRAEPLARQVFKALAQLRRLQPELASRIRLHFVGTSNQPDDRTTFRVMPIAQAEGVGDLVIETPQRVPFLQALSLLANSNGLLLIGSDEPHYTASKIYPALMSGTPYLSLFHQASSAHTILSAAGGGVSFSFETAQELAALGPALAEGLSTLARSPKSLGVADASAYSPYTAQAVAGQFAAIFDQVVA